MFAYVSFVLDNQTAKLPVSFIKKFDPDYDADKVYKVFWSRSVHAVQNENDDIQMEKLRVLQEPPTKDLWNIAEGDGYYGAFILRVEDSLDALIESLRLKRPTLRTIVPEVDISTTEDEAAVLLKQKGDVKKQEAEHKKIEMAGRKANAQHILTTAKRSRKGLFNKKNPVNDYQISDNDDEDPELIPKRMLLDLKESYEFLEKEKEKIEGNYRSLKESFKELDAKYQCVKADVEEVKELRELNRKLQEKILSFPTSQGEYANRKENEVPVNSETKEVELGAGITLDPEVYKEIFAQHTVRKFTKCLAVAIWGTETLAGRSVKGLPCRNRNGPKKILENIPTNETRSAKAPLTPEKLSVISGNNQ